MKYQCICTPKILIKLYDVTPILFGGSSIDRAVVFCVFVTSCFPDLQFLYVIKFHFADYIVYVGRLCFFLSCSGHVFGF